jgi:hypothetical protein
MWILNLKQSIGPTMPTPRFSRYRVVYDKQNERGKNRQRGSHTMRRFDAGAQPPDRAFLFLAEIRDLLTIRVLTSVGIRKPQSNTRFHSRSNYE